MRASPLLAVVLSSLAVAVASACSSESSSGVLAHTCSINTDCNSPLVCAFERCHAQCSSSRDCTGGEQCVSDGKIGVCQLADEASCSKDSDCGATGQVCVSGACRSGCRDDSACLASQHCVSGACEERPGDGGTSRPDAGPTETDAGTTPPNDAGHEGPRRDAATNPVVDAGPPPSCRLPTLATDCPSNECRSALTCSVTGECIYQALTPPSCGTCSLGKPSCDNPSAFVCDDIEVLGLAANEIECDSTKANSTFLFVDQSYTGATTNGSRTAPFRALSDALTVASAGGRGATTVVIAGSPVFTDTLVLPDGVSIRGGYTATDSDGKFTGIWRRDLSLRPIWNVSDADVSGHALVGLRAEHIVRETIVADVTIETQAIGGAGTGIGATNIGVLANDAAGLRLFDVVVVAGAGQTGGKGADSGVAANGPNVNGVDGKFGLSVGSLPPLVAGLAGAHNALCDVPESTGGDGGKTGGNGTHNGSAAPGGAAGGTAGVQGAPGAPSSSAPAAIGADGTSTSNVDPVSAVFTPGGEGATGQTGEVGHGGGGGFSDFDNLGGGGGGAWATASGGSGAAGGCGGPGGQGGFAGGWSMGLLAVNSTGLIVRGGAVSTSDGGDGGAGGVGGPGAKGGVGGNGAHDGTSSPGQEANSTAGGHGASGQQGGQGGFGAGGSSVAVYCSAGGVSFDQTPSLTPGTRGAKGTGQVTVAKLGCGN